MSRDNILMNVKGIIKYLDIKELWKDSKETMFIFEEMLNKCEELIGLGKRMTTDTIAGYIEVLPEGANTYHNAMSIREQIKLVSKAISAFQQEYLRILNYIKKIKGDI